MSQTNPTIQLRISPDLKYNAEKTFAAMGLSISDAIRLFLQQSINMNGLPFRPTANHVISSKETLDALNELDQGKGIRVSSSKELFEELGI